MKFLEKDLETIIYQYPRYCYDKGLSLNCCYMGMKMLRQVRLGKYGIADLVSIHHYDIEPGTVYNKFNTDMCVSGLRIDIIECKKGQVNINTFLQAKRYETAIRGLLDKMDLDGVLVEVDLTLIGQSMDKSRDFIYAFENTNTQAFTYSYGPKGIEFENETWGYRIKDGADGCNSPEFVAKLKEGLPVRRGYDQNLQFDKLQW